MGAGFVGPALTLLAVLRNIVPMLFVLNPTEAFGIGTVLLLPGTAVFAELGDILPELLVANRLATVSTIFEEPLQTIAAVIGYIFPINFVLDPAMAMCTVFS
jgi:hypothetical protein